VSLTDEPLAAEDGIEKDPSPTPPTKRRHIEDEQAPEATAIGDVQTGGTKTQQSETLQMGRRRQEDFIMYKALLKKYLQKFNTCSRKVQPVTYRYWVVYFPMQSRPAINGKWNRG
jgi:hypothetical protein